MQRKPSCSVLMDGWTDKHDEAFAFCTFVNASKKLPMPTSFKPNHCPYSTAKHIRIEKKAKLNIVRHDIRRLHVQSKTFWTTYLHKIISQPALNQL